MTWERELAQAIRAMLADAGRAAPEIAAAALIAWFNAKRPLPAHPVCPGAPRRRLPQPCPNQRQRRSLQPANLWTAGFQPAWSLPIHAQSPKRARRL